MSGNNVQGKGKSAAVVSGTQAGAVAPQAGAVAPVSAAVVPQVVQGTYVGQVGGLVTVSVVVGGVTYNVQAQAPAKVAGPPKAGSLCGGVWELCDQLYAKLGRRPTSNEVVVEAVSKGYNAATTNTQYGKWAKARGLVKAVQAPAAAPVQAPAKA